MLPVVVRVLPVAARVVRGTPAVVVVAVVAVAVEVVLVVVTA